MVCTASVNDPNQSKLPTLQKPRKMKCPAQSHQAGERWSRTGSKGLPSPWPDKYLSPPGHEKVVVKGVVLVIFVLLSCNI